MSKKEFSVESSLDGLYSSNSKPQDGELYTDGFYNYVFNGYFLYDSTVGNMPNQDGWGVQLKNNGSREPITQLPLDSINGWPVVNFDYAFYNSEAVFIDLRGDEDKLQVSQGIFSTGFGSKAVSISKMFSNAYAEEILLPAGFGRNAVDMNSTFENVKLSNLVLPEGFGSNASNTSYMFARSRIGNIIFPEHFCEKVVTMSYMFINLKIESISFPEGFGATVIYANRMFFSSNIKEIVLPDGFGVHVKDAGYMFACSEATTVSFPKNFGIVNSRMDGMFQNSKIDELDFPEGFCKRVLDTRAAFLNVAATVGYAATQAEADRWNKISGQSKKLKFIVKP